MITWNRLLTSTRIRDLDKGASSHRMPGDVRSEFERDYGRAVYCTPVRRLHDKAQVFPLDPHDSVRTRLTHSLEVSTVSRSLARRVARWLCDRSEIAEEHVQCLEDIAATAALLHDIGNPPFGHAGERAIQTWFRDRLDHDPSFLDFSESPTSNEQLRKDFLLFEGNAQAIRLLARLQFISDQYGLNLTAGAFSACRKYLGASHQVNTNKQELKKPGYFVSEAHVVASIEEVTGTCGARHPLAYVVEATDDIVYCLADLEDGVKKGIVSWEEIAQAFDDDPIAKEAIQKAESYVDRTRLPPRQRSESIAQMFRTFAMTPLVNEADESFRRNYDLIMEGAFHHSLLSDTPGGALLEIAKRYLRSNVFTANEVLSLELRGRRVLHDLMTLFWESVQDFVGDRRATKFSEKIYRLMSFNYRMVFEQTQQDGNLPAPYPSLQLVTDYVCGMTDSFACSIHRRLTNAN